MALRRGLPAPNEAELTGKFEDDPDMADVDGLAPDYNPAYAATALDRSNPDLREVLFTSGNPVASLDEYLKSEGLELGDTSELGGLRVVKKDKLVNRPFIIVDWKITIGKKFGQDTYYAVVYCIDRFAPPHQQAFIFTDSGTGICKGLRLYQERNNRTRMFDCPEGLTASTYLTEDEDGNEIEATTYHITQPA